MTTPGFYTNNLFIQPNFGDMTNTVLVKADSTGSVNFVSATTSNNILTIAQTSRGTTVLKFPTDISFTDGDDIAMMSLSNGFVQVNNPLKLSDGSTLTSSTISSSQVADGSITNPKMAANSVATDQIIDSNVTLQKMATASVGTAQVVDSSITLQKLALNSVGSNQIVDSNVTLQKMATASVGTAQIVDSNVTQSKLALDAVGTSQIINASVTQSKLASSSVATANIVDGSVTPAKLNLNADVTSTGSNLYDLGSVTNRFKTGYFSNIDCAAILFNGAPLQTSSGGSGSAWSNSTSNIYFTTSVTGGSVGIGTTTPTYKLHVIGDVYSSANVIAFSDARQKTEIALIPDALEKLSQIRGYTYKRLDQPDGPRYAGVIAQEVLPVLPEVVSSDPEGNLAVAYGNISALLIEAVREIKETVDTLRKDVDAIRIASHPID